MTASVNGKDLLGATITEPLTGAWSAELELDSEEAVSGRVTLDVEGAAYVGTVVRGALESGRFHAQVVGGNGALGQEQPAKHYQRAVTRLHLQELADAGGEKLSALTDAAVLSRATTRYSRRRATIGASVAQIARESKVNWRIQRDGSIWLGLDTWLPVQGLQYDELERGAGKLSIAIETPRVAPGQLFEGRKVVGVVTTLDSSSLTQEIALADSDASLLDNMQRLLGGIVESMFGHRMDFGAWYPSLVVSQSGDALDLLPDDLLMRGAGIGKVPLRHGLPGCTVKVKPGSRCVLFFEDCDPSKPAAGLWADGSSVLSIEVSADVELSLSAPLVTVSADAALVLDSPAVSITGNLAVAGNISGAAISAATVAAGPFTLTALGTHVHVIAPGTSSGPPIPGA